MLKKHEVYWSILAVTIGLLLALWVMSDKQTTFEHRHIHTTQEID